MPRVNQFTPKQMTDTVYLHLRPEVSGYSDLVRGFNVIKMAKSTTAAVEPGDYIVKVDVVIDREFFVDAMPSARVELESGAVVPLVEVAQRAEQEPTDG